MSVRENFKTLLHNASSHEYYTDKTIPMEDFMKSYVVPEDVNSIEEDIDKLKYIQYQYYKIFKYDSDSDSDSDESVYFFEYKDIGKIDDYTQKTDRIKQLMKIFESPIFCYDTVYHFLYRITNCDFFMCFFDIVDLIKHSGYLSKKAQIFIDRAQTNNSFFTEGEHIAVPGDEGWIIKKDLIRPTKTCLKLCSLLNISSKDFKEKILDFLEPYNDKESSYKETETLLTWAIQENKYIDVILESKLIPFVKPNSYEFSHIIHNNRYKTYYMQLLDKQLKDYDYDKKPPEPVYFTSEFGKFDTIQASKDCSFYSFSINFLNNAKLLAKHGYKFSQADAYYEIKTRILHTIKKYGTVLTNETYEFFKMASKFIDSYHNIIMHLVYDFIDIFKSSHIRILVHNYKKYVQFNADYNDYNAVYKALEHNRYDLLETMFDYGFDVTNLKDIRTKKSLLTTALEKDDITDDTKKVIINLIKERCSIEYDEYDKLLVLGIKPVEIMFSEKWFETISNDNINNMIDGKSLMRYAIDSHRTENIEMLLQYDILLDKDIAHELIENLAISMDNDFIDTDDAEDILFDIVPKVKKFKDITIDLIKKHFTDFDIFSFYKKKLDEQIDNIRKYKEKLETLTKQKTNVEKERDSYKKILEESYKESNYEDYLNELNNSEYVMIP